MPTICGSTFTPRAAPSSWACRPGLSAGIGAREDRVRPSLEQIDPTPPLAVFAEVAEAEELAWRRQLAARLGLPLWRPRQPAPSRRWGRAGGPLHLRQPRAASAGRVRSDFSTAELQRRRQGAALLWRAVRGRRRGDLAGLDGTAGLGRGACQLAAGGARVDLIRRPP